MNACRPRAQGHDRLPILAMTANASAKDREECREVSSTGTGSGLVGRWNRYNPAGASLWARTSAGGHERLPVQAGAEGPAGRVHQPGAAGYGHGYGYAAGCDGLAVSRLCGLRRAAVVTGCMAHSTQSAVPSVRACRQPATSAGCACPAPLPVALGLLAPFKGGCGAPAFASHAQWGLCAAASCPLRLLKMLVPLAGAQVLTGSCWKESTEL